MTIDKTRLQSDLIFDVGLHKGEDTAFYLKKGFRVIAFEADPELVEYCNQKFADEIRNEQLVIVSGAILPHNDAGKLPQSVKFYKNTKNSCLLYTSPSPRDRG